MFDRAEKGSPAGERFRAAECCSLSLRERVRVRGNAAPNGIPRAKDDATHWNASLPTYYCLLLLTCSRISPKKL